MATLFFSYSHADEGLRDQLETHLASLKRQGVISAWHDRRITAGSNFAQAIDDNLDSATVVLLLVSPDFIASDYCYDREMTRAMERHNSTQARVIPVILRPCDWHGLPLGSLLATPRDGKPITTWANTDEAFLNVVQAIKAAVQELGVARKPTDVLRKMAGPVSLEATAAPAVPRSSNIRVRKEFTDLDRDRFRHEGFDFIAKYFEASMQEMVARNPGFDYQFRRVDTDHFTAALYRNGEKVCKGAASLGGDVFSRGGISYVMDDSPRGNSMNEAVYVRNDDQSLYFEMLGMQFYGNNGDKDKLSPQGAAEHFWEIFVRPMQ